MIPERWQQVDQLYHSALEREPDSHEAVKDMSAAAIIRLSLQTRDESSPHPSTQ